MKARILTVATLAVCSIAVLAQVPASQRSSKTTSSQFAPRDTPREPRLSIRAKRIERQGSLILYRGDVRIETETLTISADELDLNVSSREADLRGSVHAKILPGVRAVPLTE